LFLCFIVKEAALEFNAFSVPIYVWFVPIAATYMPGSWQQPGLPVRKKLEIHN